MRRKIIAGNWKMNKLPNEALDFITKLEPLVKNSENEIVLCVPYIDLFYTLLNAQGTNIKIGAQNMHWEKEGAYTGEISSEMLKAIGVEYVIIGHSERRKYFNETDEDVNKKIIKALEVGLKPIVCVGETLEERENHKEKEVIKNQIEKAFKNIKDISNVIIAYEPIWAIGTGKTATSEDANEITKFIREEILKIYGKDVADCAIILYGGSVKPSNAKELFEMSDIDGGLIGGASLNAKDFANIVNYNI